jgi:hypothetical protein
MADAPQMGDEMDEAQPPTPTPAPEEQDATATVPIDFCPGMTPKEGDEYKVRVVSVDENDGTQTIVYAPDEENEGESGIGAATAQMKQGGIK